jgi:hypothetical protein
VPEDTLVANGTQRCSVLLINPLDDSFAQRAVLEDVGFRVTLARQWPDDDESLLEHHVVIVRLREVRDAPMIAARVRAKPRFGRRVLIALVPDSASAQDRHSARASGFDQVLTTTCDGRQLAARILRCLRTRPEYHCVLPGDRRRSAA